MTDVAVRPTGLILPPEVEVPDDQLPYIALTPPAVTSAGQEVIELAAMAGLILDPWQQLLVHGMCAEREDGKWAAFEVGVCVPRQNGKNGALEARELAGLFLFGERLLIHSAHQFDTSLEAFLRLKFLIENTDDFRRRVRRVSHSHGDEGVTLKNGQRIRFRTRTGGGGRGFSCDFLALDEAMDISEKAHGALLPTLSARDNPQVVYTGSAVDEDVHDNGIVFARVRDRALRRESDLAYYEWRPQVPAKENGEEGGPDEVTPELAADPQAWQAANPAHRIRITTEHIAKEQRSMNPRTFAVERLGVGAWPSVNAKPAEIDLEKWVRCRDEDSVIRDPVVIAYDVRPDRGASAIVAAGWRDDGLPGVEVIDHRAGTGWVTDRLQGLQDSHFPEAIGCDGKSPGAALLGTLKNLGVEVEAWTLDDHARACGVFFDCVENETLRHLGTQDLDNAVRGAAKRSVGDRWLWSRRESQVDITPLVAATLALGRLIGGEGPSIYETRGLLSF